MRFCMISIGIIYILTAVWTFANKGVAFIALAFILGLAMIVQGVVSLLAYLVKCRHKIPLSYILSDGIIAIILGIAVISNRLVTDVEVPLLFGMWIIFSGTKRISTSFNIGRRRAKMRKGIFFIGLVDILFGIGMLFNTVVLALPNIVLVALCFFVQGINIIAAGNDMLKPANFYNREKEYVRNIPIKMAKKQAEKQAKSHKPKTRSEKFAERNAQEILANAQARAAAEAKAMEEAKMLKMLGAVQAAEVLDEAAEEAEEVPETDAIGADEETETPIEAETAELAEDAAIGDVVYEEDEI